MALRMKRMHFGPSAGPLPSRPAWPMCLPVNPASIGVPSGDRPGSPAFSAARLGEGQFHLSWNMNSVPKSTVAETGYFATPTLADSEKPHCPLAK